MNLKDLVQYGQFEVFDCGKVFINQHVNKSHYVLYTIFIEEQFIGYYDSLNSSLPSAFPFESVKDRLQHEWQQHSVRISNPLIPFDRKGWKFERVRVKQQNGADCAFHVIRNTLLLQMDLPLLEYEVVPPTLSLFLTIFLKC
jgi:Ulp1 family protease